MMKKIDVWAIVVSIVAAFLLGVFVAEIMISKEKDGGGREAFPADTDDLVVYSMDEVEGLNGADSSDRATDEDEMPDEQSTSTSAKIDPDDYKPDIDWEFIGKIGKKAGSKAVRLGKSALDSGVCTGKKIYRWAVNKLE